MGRCNLLLSRTGEAAANVLVVGSSRTGVALDPMVMEQLLAAELGFAVRVDRLAMGHSPLRAMNGLLANYLEARDAPRIVVLEIMFITRRGLDQLARRGLAVAPEDYIYQRDVNLLEFRQILGQAAVAMPFTMHESVFNLWRQRLKGVILRAGALIYQSLRDPTLEWDVASCDREAWTRETVWPSDFAFSYGDFDPGRRGLATLIETMQADVARLAASRELHDWQSEVPEGRVYPYDFDANYRRGEVRILESMIRQVLGHGSEVVLLPLPLYGYEIDRTELAHFVRRFGARVHLFDLYGAVDADFGPLWYDDAHVERTPVGRLTTALMAENLLRHEAYR